MNPPVKIAKFTKWSIGLILFWVSACSVTDKIEVTRHPALSPTSQTVAEVTITTSPIPVNTTTLTAFPTVPPEETNTSTFVPTPSPTGSPPTVNPTEHYTPIFTPTSTPSPSSVQLTLTAHPTSTPSPTTAFEFLPLPAEIPGDLELVGQLGGYVSAVIARGTYVYLAVGPRVVVLNVATPNQPVFAGQSEVLTGVIDAMAVTETHAYAITQKGNLHIISITNPTFPTLVATYLAQEVDFLTRYRDIAIADQRAYVMFGRYEGSYLSIIDISDPANPFGVATYPLPAYAKDVAVAGNYVYIAAKEAVIILDVTDLTHPIEVSRIPQEVRRVTVVGEYLYLAAGEDGLRIFNVTNPASPLSTTIYQTDILASQVIVEGNYVYVSDNFGTEGTSYIFYQYGPPLNVGNVQVLDATTPSALVEIGRFETGAQIWNLDIHEGYAYIATGDLSVVDLRLPASPSTIGAYEMVAEVWDVALNGRYAYLAAGNQGLFTVDMIDPATPLVTNQWQSSGHALRVLLEEGYLYLSNNFRVAYFANPQNPSVGVSIFNTDNQAAPVEIGYYEDVQMDTLANWNFTAVDNTLYLTQLSRDGLQIVEPNSVSPMIKFYYTFDRYLHSVAIAENYAYITGEAGLLILDITNTAEPITISVGFDGYDLLPSVNPLANFYTGDIILSAGYAYVDCLYDRGEIGTTSTLCIIDVRDPAAPRLAAVYDISGSMSLIEDRIYIAECGKYFVMDAATPTVVSEVIRVPQNPYVGCGGNLFGDYIYVAAGAGGLYVFRFSY